jgi:voltage-gated potassium channel
MRTKNIRSTLFHILHKPSPTNPVARYVNYFLAFLILTNALCVSLETVPSIAANYGQLLKTFEAVSTGLLISEYMARLWVCVEQARYSAPLRGRLSYALHPLPLLDLLVIVTFWWTVDLRFLRVARMVRLLKVLKLDHFEKSLERITTALRKRRELLIVSITMMGLSIYASASLLYQVEHAAQPTIFSSIPATFWWAMETLTTIGYGDMVPKTYLGKLFAGVISIFGIGIFALPTAIITAAIVEAGVSDPEPVICKHCGRSEHQLIETRI